MSVIEDIPGESVVVRDVSWKTYESLLSDYADRRSPRLAYDRGTLEIMAPSFRHEKRSVSLASLVEAVADEWGIDAEACGSTTFKRSDLEGGFEPDACFYIQHATEMLEKDEIDLGAGDPVPDLVIEIDVTHPSLEKFPLYARLGIPEIWRANRDGEVIFFFLEEGIYQVVETSPALPLLTGAAVNELLRGSQGAHRLAWLRRVRAWAREQL